MKKQKFRRKQQKYRYRGEVIISPVAWITGLICLPFMTWLLTASILEKVLWEIIVAGLLFLLPVSLLLTANWKITYDAVGFTYRNYFRQVRYYHYSEITKICRKNDSYIYIGRKRITIDTMALGGTHFLEIAVRQTPKAEHSGFLKR